MANRKDSRIEPSFEASPEARSSAGFSVSEEDRVVPSNRKAAAKRKSSKAKPSRGGRGKSRRGLFGVLARLFYWCFVLAIWGGIATAGIVVYY
ncbi:MAG: penicillin-binding protein, partial [Mesorhizobium sp.]